MADKGAGDPLFVNKIAAAVLTAGLIGMSAGFLSDLVFHQEAGELAFNIEVAEDAGGAVADAAPNDDRLEQVWETFLASFDEVVAARIAEDQAKGVTPEFDPYPVARALNRMNASILTSSFARGRKADKEDVLSAFLRIWLSTLYPFDAEAAINSRKA